MAYFLEAGGQVVNPAILTYRVGKLENEVYFPWS
jgi:hypothetical protein